VTSAKVIANLDFAPLLNGQQAVIVRHLYGQLGNLTVGNADPTFSDPDATPNTIDSAGPNASVYFQHLVIGYFMSFYRTDEESIFAFVSAEQAETSVTAGGGFVDYKHIPDLAVKLRWQNKYWGHVQAAAIFRDLGVENDPYTTRKEVLGWGVKLTGSILPFCQVPMLQKDVVSFGVTHGDGIGSYINDLRVVGGTDAVFDGTDLKPLHVFAYYAGYTHYWTENLRSTFVYSQVNLEASPLLGAGGYHAGRYCSANIVYNWQVRLPSDPADKPGHIAFTGLEYLYGEKETLGNGKGQDQRILFTFGLKF
jgi:hypothetical protein